jgi:hypothetical protein
MFTAITLVVLAVVCRLSSPVFHTWNFVPMGAVALYAGSRLPRRWAWIVPVLAIVLSDLVLDFGTPRPILELSRWTVYATLAATSLLGRFANLPKVGRWLLPLLSLSSSAIFFLTTNLATWAEGHQYPLTLAGLVECYTLALPFYGRNTILADLLGTGLLFGLGPVFEHLFGRLRPARLWGTEPEVNPTSASSRA